MITGFNTDVRHGDVVFHVQTEDKGTGNPCIETLVYVGGQILARKRAGYRSLLEGGEATKAVAELMEQQHKAMIQQIRAGKMDEKVAAIKGGRPKAAPGAAPATSAVPPPAQTAPPAPKVAAAPPAPSNRVAPPPEASPRPATPPRAAPPAAAASSAAHAPAPPRPRPPQPSAQPAPARPATPPRAAPMPPARPHPQPPTPRPPSSEEASDRTLDQVILDYLEMESDQDRLVMTMNRRDGELAAGQSATLLFRTESSIDRDPIGQAQIRVSLISTIDEPQVLAEGRTNDKGELVLQIAIPELKAGTGAVIISAESSIGNAEARHLI